MSNKWRKDPISDRQRKLLLTLGIKPPATKGEASDIISKSQAALRLIEIKKQQRSVFNVDERDWSDDFEYDPEYEDLNDPSDFF